jgi:excinuclease ABC subunit C
VIITDEAWPRIFLARARDLEHNRKNRKPGFKIRKQFGPFLESGLIKVALKILRGIFPFRDKKAHDPRHEEFYRVLGQSPDRRNAETGDIEARKRYTKTIRYLTLFFEGRSKHVRILLEREMKRNARMMRFEEAASDRKLLNALRHINDIALIKRNHNNGLRPVKECRIEAYDIAHLAGKDVVGSMAVTLNGEPTPSEYRKFKLSREANDDLANLSEILSRRLNHTEWPYPDLIAVDGNENQKRAAEAVLKARRIEIPVVAVTKDESHKAERLIGSEDIVKEHRQSIISANSEAHRFAIKYHRKRRGMH